MNIYSSDLLVCSKDMEDLLGTYASYAPLWDVKCPHVLDGVRSQLKPAGWRRMLEVIGKEDENCHFIMDGILHGFKIVDPGSVIASYSTANYRSALVNAFDFIDNLIKDELESGKLSVPMGNRIW